MGSIQALRHRFQRWLFPNKTLTIYDQRSLLDRLKSAVLGLFGLPQTSILTLQGVIEPPASESPVPNESANTLVTYPSTAPNILERLFERLFSRLWPSEYNRI